MMGIAEATVTPVSTLHVQTNGDAGKPALVLLNSLGTTLHMWDAQAKALESAFFVIRMDTRGHGKSPLAQAAVTLESLGQDVMDVMDALGIDKAFVCGISMGGLTALWLGLNHPERFHRVVAANTAARIGTAEAWNLRAQTVRAGGPSAMLALAQTAPQRWFTPRFTKMDPIAVETLCSQLSHTDPQGYAQCCDALADGDIREQLSSFSIPLCLVAGEEDPVTTPADAKFLEQRVSGAQLHLLRASHLSNIEQANAFNEILLDFFTRPIS